MRGILELRFGKTQSDTTAIAGKWLDKKLNLAIVALIATTVSSAIAYVVLVLIKGWSHNIVATLAFTMLLLGAPMFSKTFRPKLRKANRRIRPSNLVR